MEPKGIGRSLCRYICFVFGVCLAYVLCLPVVMAVAEASSAVRSGAADVTSSDIASSGVSSSGVSSSSVSSSSVLNLPADLTRDKGHYLFRLSLQQGDYIQGRVQSEGPAHAWLSTPDRAFWRHLNRYGAEDARFSWIAPQTGTYFLEVKAEQAWQVNLSPLKRLPFDPPKPVHKRPESPLIQRAIERLQAGQSEDKVWSDLVAQGTPLVEPLAQYAEQAPHLRLVTFLWRGAEHNVLLFSGLGQVNNTLYRLPYSRDIWFRTYQMPDDTRMSYQLAPDVPSVEGADLTQEEVAQATAQRDPYNHESWGPRWDQPFDRRADPFSLRSILALSRVPQETYLARPETPLPFMQRYHFNGPPNRAPQVDLWQPDHLTVKDGMSIPVVIFLNGQLYQHEIPGLRILQNLMDERLIPPVMAALVSYPNQAARQEALTCQPEFADFLAQQLIPLISHETGYRLRRHQIMLVGAGYGGLAAACAAYQYPEYFGMVLSQSGAFWWHPQSPDESEAIVARFEHSDPQIPIRFYLSAGWFESRFDQRASVLSSTQHLAQALSNKGYQVTPEWFNAGHDVYHWRTTLWRGLVNLLGPLSSEVKMPR